MPATRSLVSILLLVATCGASMGQEPVIYRCTLPDGTTAFQGMPCDEAANPAGESDTASDIPEQTDEDSDESARGAFDFVNPFDAPAESARDGAPVESRPPLSADRAEREKQARDAIDAIDLEMRSGYTKAEGEAYLAELLELTRALRACKAL